MKNPLTSVRVISIIAICLAAVAVAQAAPLKFGWDQLGVDAPSVQGYSYRLSIDGATGVALTGVICTGPATATGFACTGIWTPSASTTAGTHSATLTTYLADGSTSSGPSAPPASFVVPPILPTTPAIPTRLRIVP